MVEAHDTRHKRGVQVIRIAISRGGRNLSGHGGFGSAAAGSYHVKAVHSVTLQMLGGSRPRPRSSFLTKTSNGLAASPPDCFCVFRKVIPGGSYELPTCLSAYSCVRSHSQISCGIQERKTLAADACHLQLVFGLACDTSTSAGRNTSYTAWVAVNNCLQAFSGPVLFRLCHVHPC